MIEIKNLLQEGEAVAELAITGSYCPYHIIMEKQSDDIAAALENTLHRILDAGGDSEAVQEIMGAHIPTQDERKELEEYNEYIEIDLGYVLPGLIYSIKFV